MSTAVSYKEVRILLCKSVNKIRGNLQQVYCRVPEIYFVKQQGAFVLFLKPWLL
jgi:hypothetical protein